MIGPAPQNESESSSARVVSPAAHSQPGDLQRQRSGFARPASAEEWRCLVLSALYFFFVLFSFYMLRPIRESLGIQRGYDKLPMLMTGTLCAMLLASPLYAWAASRWPRRVFVARTYRFFQLHVLLFFALFQLLPSESRVGLGYAFYIWLSVYNLFVVSVFWSVMTDAWSREQGVRLFGLVGIGGTLGAIAGAAAAKVSAAPMSLPALEEFTISAPMLMLLAVAPLEGAVQCVKRILRRASQSAPAGAASREPSPKVLEGLRLLVRRPYVALIALYLLLYAVTSTFLYIEQGRLVEHAFPDEASRRAAFASIDLWTNTLTLVTQALITGNLMPRIGIAASLAIVPLLTAAGFVALATAPIMGVLAAFQMLRRGLHYAIDRPAREVLFTILGPDEKYKSKNFIDTVIYRAGDMAGSWGAVLLTTLSIPFAIGLSALWLGVSVATGCAHVRERARQRTLEG